jgi:hypothetical protein
MLDESVPERFLAAGVLLHERFSSVPELQSGFDLLAERKLSHGAASAGLRVGGSTYPSISRRCWRKRVTRQLLLLEGARIRELEGMLD